MDRNRGKRNKKERKEETKADPKKTRMITIGGITFVVIAIAGLLIANAVNRSGDHTGEALTPSGSSIQKGRDYLEVVEEFEENGFTNIKTEPLGDLITGWLTKENQVEAVSIGGDEDYSPDKWVPDDTEVIISYHSFPASEDTEEQIESDEAEEVETPEAETSNTDAPEQSEPSNESNVTAAKSTEDKLEEKLGVSYAWSAMEMHGKEVYPYGFTLHYVTGVLAEKAEDENTWFLKAKCTYTNDFGTEADGNCEARITGTSDNPEITYFVVY